VRVNSGYGDDKVRVRVGKKVRVRARTRQRVKYVLFRVRVYCLGSGGWGSRLA